MDPNTLLDEIRNVVTLARNGDDGSYEQELCDKFEALDKWLIFGGFLPMEWRNN